MKTVLAVDVYGTVIDMHGLFGGITGNNGRKSPFFSDTWRNRQLEYSFRRVLMRQYQHFSV